MISKYLIAKYSNGHDMWTAVREGPKPAEALGETFWGAGLRMRRGGWMKELGGGGGQLGSPGTVQLKAKWGRNVVG